MKSGRFVSIDVLLNRLNIDSRTTLDPNDASEWIASALSRLPVEDVMFVKVTDGNNGNPDPVKVKNYRAEIPCDCVNVRQVFDYASMRAMRQSSDNLMTMNFSDNPRFTQTGNTPDRYLSGKGDDSFIVKNGYIFAGFKTGYLVLSYDAWPVDEYQRLMIPSDQHIFDALAAFLQERADYRAWRAGLISDKVYQDSQQERYFEMGRAESVARTANDSQMEAFANVMTGWLVKEQFANAFSSLGRNNQMKRF